MPNSSSLQDNLFSRLPDLQWLLDSNGDLIEPLLHQWGLQALRTQQYALHYKKHFTDVKDVLFWAVEKKASASSLQTTFDWLHRAMVTLPVVQNESAQLLKTLKKDQPELLQLFLQNLSLHNSVWNTSFAMQYAPDQQKVWDTNPDWKSFYSGANALAWTKKESNQYNACRLAWPDEAVTKTMHRIMGAHSFELWQYGAYMSLLIENSNVPNGAPSGNKYGFANALLMIEPAVSLGLAPNAKKLALDTVRRYKGKGLVEDMLRGLDYCMEKYETEGRQVNLDYCATMLNTVIPFAITEGFASLPGAPGMDQKITEALSGGRIETTVASAWFEARLNTPRRTAVDIKKLAPFWPENLREKLVLREATHQHSSQKSYGENTLALFQHWAFDPTLTKVMLNNMAPVQWTAFQAELDSNDRTSAVVSLLKTPHPLVEEYKSSPRARVSVVAACMVVLNEKAYSSVPKYQGLAILFGNDNNTSVGKLSLPQPLFYFANCFPQYRETWQRLACEMANQNPMNGKTQAFIRNSNPDRVGATRVVNALASLMLGKSVDAESMLQVREALDASMSYEELVQSQFNSTDVFRLPDAFDESIFESHDGPSL